MSVCKISNIGLYVTKLCDRNCGYCLLDTVPTSEPDIMSLETAVGSVTTLVSNAAEKVEIEFFGGEPLCSIDRIFEIITELKERVTTQIEFTLWTNAVRFSVEHWEAMRNEDMTFIINGYLESQEEDYVSQPQQLKSMLQARGPGLRKGIFEFPDRFALTWLVQSSKQDLTQIAVEVGNIGFSRLYFLPERDKQNQVRWTEDEFDQILQRYGELIDWYFSEECPTEFKVEPLESVHRHLKSPNTRQRCGFCRTSVAVSTSGLVCPCYTVIGEKPFSLGHYRDNEVVNEQLEKLKALSYCVPVFCSKCEALNTCGGVCIYEKIIASKKGTPFAKPNDCGLQLFLRKQLLSASWEGLK